MGFDRLTVWHLAWTTRHTLELTTSGDNADQQRQVHAELARLGRGPRRGDGGVRGPRRQPDHPTRRLNAVAWSFSGAKSGWNWTVRQPRSDDHLMSDAVDHVERSERSDPAAEPRHPRRRPRR